MVAVHCSRCHTVAATFSVVHSDDRAWLERAGWFGVCQVPMPLARAEAWMRRITTEPLGELARAERDLFGFVCRACELAYCSACWTIGPPEMDEGFYDCTRGTCPLGHTQTLDD